MTQTQFHHVLNAKAHGTWNLYKAFPNELDFFVILSSSAGIGGSRGQFSYAAGNAFQDALAHQRRGQGLRCTAIDVGRILGVGFVAENAEAIDNLKS